MEKFKARLVFCQVQVFKNENECLSPVVDHKSIEHLFRLVIQNEQVTRHYDFQNPFSNGKLSLSVHDKLPKRVYNEKVRDANVIKLQRS